MRTVSKLHDWLLIRFCSFQKKYRLIATDLNKQKALDADSKAIHQIIFTGKVDIATVVYYIYEK